MIAVDTNVLVYSHRSDSPFHAPAHTLIERLRSGRALWAIPWPCVHEFLSIVTHPKIYKRPTPLATAFEAINSWRAADNLQLLSESEGYLEKLDELARAAQVRGPVIHDARIAALCLHHGVRELWSADRDFSKFTGLSVRNPLRA